MQSLMIKERVLLELQIAQTRHPKSVAEVRRGPTTRPAFCQDDAGKTFNIYSNKKETSDFHGTVSFDPVKMLQQK